MWEGICPCCGAKFGTPESHETHVQHCTPPTKKSPAERLEDIIEDMPKDGGADDPWHWFWDNRPVIKAALEHYRNYLASLDGKPSGGAKTEQPAESSRCIVAKRMEPVDLERVTNLATLDIGIPCRQGGTIGLFPVTVRALLGHIAWLDQIGLERESVDPKQEWSKGFNKAREIYQLPVDETDAVKLLCEGYILSKESNWRNKMRDAFRKLSPKRNDIEGQP